MDRHEDDAVEHAEVFVLTRTAEQLFVRCDCPASADHPFERPMRSGVGAREGAGAPAQTGAADVT